MMWQGKFGVEYTKRNLGHTAHYKEHWEFSREEMNREFIGGLDGEMLILEVGCNVGEQLGVLMDMGFWEVYGIDVNEEAVKTARCNGLQVCWGDAEEITFTDGVFDLVFTSGLLIHIPPDKLEKVMGEIYRCSKKYIWGFEFYSDKHIEIPYRGQMGMLWKGDFAQMYLDRFSDLKLVKEKRYKRLKNNNIDSMFLLEKTG